MTDFSYSDPGHDDFGAGNDHFDEADIAVRERTCAPTANDYEFHRRRTERELDCALRAPSAQLAARHLALARLHNRKARGEHGGAGQPAAAFVGIDKEA